MDHQSSQNLVSKPRLSTHQICVELWILFAAGLSLGGWILSGLRALTVLGYVVLLGLITIGLCLWVVKKGPRWRGLRLHATKKHLSNPFAALYLVLFLAQAIGGSIYSPTNYDGLTYRVPRVLHYLAEQRWHWMGAWNDRMNLSALGYEWMMAPFLAITQSDRLLFLPNLVVFALLPGLIFTTFRGLGVVGRVARYWMWLFPCAYGLVLQAGSIGNDAFALPFLLASLTFSARACRNQSSSDTCLAIVAMSLLTGVKASNLPLLLPCSLAFLPIVPQLFQLKDRSKNLIKLGLVALLAIIVSFIPSAIINWRITGDWTGDPLNAHGVKLGSPIFGIAGNTLQILSENLEPPILPNAASINSYIKAGLNRPFLQDLVDQFPRLSLGVNDLAGEEAAGLGLGLTVLGLAFHLMMLRDIPKITFVWSRFPKKRVAFWVSAGAWVAILVFMMKLGSESAPRIATPYYPLLLLLPSLLPTGEWLIRRKSWLVFSFLAAASVLPAVILSPARPLFPVGTLVAFLERRSPDSPMANRVKTVYEVYARRSDPHAQVREQLPPGTRKIGFAGTADESEISFWRPFGERSVRDLVPTEPDKLPDVAGLDAIVTSDWGCNDRYGKTSEELAAVIGWSINQTITVRSRAGSSPRTWSILAPPTFGTTSE